MKLAICTGVSSGLGESLAEALLEKGFHVIGISRRTPTVKHTNLIHLSMDLSKNDYDFNKIESQIDAHQDYEEVWLINCSGTLDPVGKIIDLEDRNDLNAAFHLNAVMPLALSGWFIKVFKNVERRVIQISSGAARKAYHGWMTYCATKAALKMATEAMALDYSNDKQIKFFIYEPGVVDTPMQDRVRNIDEEVFSNLQRFKDLKQNGELIAPLDSARFMIQIVEKKVENNLVEFRYSI